MGGGLIHLIRGSRCGERASLRPSNTTTQMELQEKALQILLDCCFTVDNIARGVLSGHSDCSNPAFLQPGAPMEPSNAKCPLFSLSAEDVAAAPSEGHKHAASSTEAGRCDSWPGRNFAFLTG